MLSHSAFTSAHGGATINTRVRLTILTYECSFVIDSRRSGFANTLWFGQMQLRLCQRSQTNTVEIEICKGGQSEVAIGPRPFGGQECTQRWRKKVGMMLRFDGWVDNQVLIVLISSTAQEVRANATSHISCDQVIRTHGQIWPCGQWAPITRVTGCWTLEHRASRVNGDWLVGGNPTSESMLSGWRHLYTQRGCQRPEID